MNEKVDAILRLCLSIMSGQTMELLALAEVVEDPDVSKALHEVAEVRNGAVKEITEALKGEE